MPSLPSTSNDTINHGVHDEVLHLEEPRPVTEITKVPADPFLGRSFQVVTDFNERELLFLYKQIALLKYSTSQNRQEEYDLYNNINKNFKFNGPGSFPEIYDLHDDEITTESGNYDHLNDIDDCDSESTVSKSSSMFTTTSSKVLSTANKLKKGVARKTTKSFKACEGFINHSGTKINQAVSQESLGQYYNGLKSNVVDIKRAMRKNLKSISKSKSKKQLDDDNSGLPEDFVISRDMPNVPEEDSEMVTTVLDGPSVASASASIYGQAPMQSSFGAPMRTESTESQQENHVDHVEGNHQAVPCDDSPKVTQAMPGGVGKTVVDQEQAVADNVIDENLTSESTVEVSTTAPGPVTVTKTNLPFAGLKMSSAKMPTVVKSLQKKLSKGSNSSSNGTSGLTQGPSETEIQNEGQMPLPETPDLSIHGTATPMSNLNQNQLNLSNCIDDLSEISLNVTTTANTSGGDLAVGPPSPQCNQQVTLDPDQLALIRQLQKRKDDLSLDLKLTLIELLEARKKSISNRYRNNSKAQQLSKSLSQTLSFNKPDLLPLSYFRLSPPISAPAYQKCCYLIFLENSTRTRESFRNAAMFHDMKVNIFDCSTSSFSKGETITDAIKMLVNYSAAQTVFVIRSKWEGTCRWLQMAIANKYCNRENLNSGFHLSKNLVGPSAGNSNGKLINITHADENALPDLKLDSENHDTDQDLDNHISDSDLNSYTTSLHTKPSFLNAGDGKHEHPTQELLDEFTFLEHMNFDRSSIHIALLGDLYHGRTAHSKCDGLKIFKKVKVDLIAPMELQMPSYYIEKMRKCDSEFQSFEVRLFPSIDDYLKLGQENVANIWYFTRLQLERMSDEVQAKEQSLRRAVTFRKEDHMGKLKEGTKFYHPLPRDSRHPVIPFSIDDTSLNGWDRQSLNGYYARTILLSLVGGKLGREYLESEKRYEGITLPNLLSDGSDETEETESDNHIMTKETLNTSSIDFSTFSSDDIPDTDLRCPNNNCISHPDNGQREVKPFFVSGVCQYCDWKVQVGHGVVPADVKYEVK